MKNKNELEEELTKVRAEIQWREREGEGLSSVNPSPYWIVIGTFTLILIFCPLFGDKIGLIIAIVVSVIITILLWKSYWKSRKGRRHSKAIQELQKLRRRKAELEKQIDELEIKEEKIIKKSKKK